MSNLAIPVEYITTDSGVDTKTNKPVVIITCRMNPEESFGVSNLIFSKENAERLHQHLGVVLTKVLK